MKIKSGFVLEKVGGGYLAVAVGKRAAEFSGMVRMNETGAFLWNIMAERDASREELIDAIAAQYEVAKEQAAVDISGFLETLTANGIIE